MPFSRALTTSWENEPYDKIISYSDATPIIVLKNGKVYVPIYPYFAGGNVVPSTFQNRDASRCDLPKKYYKGPFTAMKIPGSTTEDNVRTVDVKASVDGGLLHIVRQKHLNGLRERRAGNDLSFG